MANIRPDSSGRDLFQVQTIGSNRVVNCISIRLPDDLPEVAVNTTIYAYDVVINDGYSSINRRLPFVAGQSGADIEIIARRIKCNPVTRARLKAKDVVIDAGGNAGNDAPQFPKAPSTDSLFGANGTDGDPGSPGGNAGNIVVMAEQVLGRIYLFAGGGDGGGGQPGGAGYPGEAGAYTYNAFMAARYDVTWWPLHMPHNNLPYDLEKLPGATGGDGTAGGNAGTGGMGGNGGNAGHVSVQLINRSGADIGVFEDGGTGGTTGRNGSPGWGGGGGRGGLHRGKDGPNGNPGRSQPATGQDGQSYSKFTIKTITYEDFLFSSSISQLSMLVHWAELLYQSDDYAKATDALNWLELITRHVNDSNYASSLVSSIELVKSMRGRAIALLSQLKVGTDYYGLPRNYVSLTPLITLKSYTNDMLNYTKNMNEIYNIYLTQQSEQENAIRQAVDHSKAVVDSYQVQISEINSKITYSNQIIETLTSELQLQKEVLIAAEESFKNAIASQASCDFLDVVSFVATVLTAGQAAYTAIAGIVTSAGDFIAPGLTMGRVITDVKSVDTNLQNLKKAYNDIKDDVSKSPDSKKLLIDEDHFDQLVDQFADLQAAQDYKQEMHKYVDLAKARNQRILEYSSFLGQVQDLSSKIDYVASQAQMNLALLAEKGDPTLPEHVAFLGHLLFQSKKMTIDALHDEYRAFEYWSMSFGDFPLVGDQESVELGYTQQTIEAEITQALNNLSTAKAGFHTAQPIVIERKNYKASWDRFANDPKSDFVVTFKIQPSDIPGYNTKTTVNTISIEIPGIVTANGGCFVRIQHDGISTFFLSRDTLEKVSFLHPWISIVIGPGSNPGPNILNGEYSEVSPFAIWTLKLSREDNLGLDMSRVDRILIDFSGHFTPMF